MCVIYACSTALPDEEELHRGAFRNDDGTGVAWLDKVKGKDRVFWKKGMMNEKEVLAFIQKEKLPLPIAIHFRTASVGGKCDELCHPFPVSDEAPLYLEGNAEQVLMHNGHLGNWEDLVLRAALGLDIQVPEGPWSDSRALAWLIALKGPGLMPFINNTSRVLLFSAEPDRWEGMDYNRAEDHFRLFGSWVHKGKEGFAQSIATEWGNATVTPGRKYLTKYDDGVEDACATSVANKTSSADRAVLNIWTVAELRDVLERVEKELGDARTTAGV